MSGGSFLENARRTEVVDRSATGDIPFADLIDANQPFIVRGVGADWPIVKAGLKSPEEAMDYLSRFHSGRPVILYSLAPEHGGQPFYDETVTAMNFERSQVSLEAFFSAIKQTFDEAEPSGLYVQSTDQMLFFPGFEAENGIDMAPLAPFAKDRPVVSLWLGGKTTARAHYDMSNNIAVCLVGRRRFILFPPEQVHNLYPGPLAPTPGGQVISMVDIHDPDLEAHPKFEAAAETAQIADLEPGDLLIYPALWWHQVEAKAPFNLLLNYWWNAVPSHADTPMNTLLHGLLSLRDRPAAEKAAWREMFDYYVFGAAEQAGAHLPPAARGPLGEMNEMMARRLRAELLRKLNR